VDEKYPKLFCGDMLKELIAVPDNSVDLIIADLPYGISGCSWDTPIHIESMWRQFNRISKQTAAMVFTATMLFAARLITSNTENFRYDWVWEKKQASGQLNVNKMPLRAHELVLVFYRKHGTYNEQKLPGTPYTIHRKATWETQGYGEQKTHTTVNTGYRRARSVITFGNRRAKGNHPTQKPIELMKYLIQVYSNPGDVVLDPCMGSGTTGVAAQLIGRHFIGVELDLTWFERAQTRIQEAQQEAEKV
jgi:DNA modification methylase